MKSAGTIFRRSQWTSQPVKCPATPTRRPVPHPAGVCRLFLRTLLTLSAAAFPASPHAGSEQLPDPLPAMAALANPTNGFRVVFEIQHDPVRTGVVAEPYLFPGYGRLHSFKYYSQPFEVLFQRDSFVAFSNPPLVDTEGRRRDFIEIFGFYAPWQFHWIVTVGRDIRLAHGPLEPPGPFDQGPVFDFSKLQGNSVRLLVSQVHNWLRAAIFLGIHDWAALRNIENGHGTYLTTAGETKAFTCQISNHAITSLTTLDTSGYPEWLVEPARMEPLAFGRYPRVVSRYRPGPAGRPWFDKRFTLHEFTWLDAGVSTAMFMPTSNPFALTQMIHTYVFLESPTGTLYLRNNLWLPLATSPAPGLRPPRIVPPVTYWDRIWIWATASMLVLILLVRATSKSRKREP